METYRSEYMELLKWYADEREKIPFIPSSGFDGGSTEQINELFYEYRRRLRELRKKYNVIK